MDNFCDRHRAKLALSVLAATLLMIPGCRVSTRPPAHATASRPISASSAPASEAASSEISGAVSSAPAESSSGNAPSGSTAQSGSGYSFKGAVPQSPPVSDDYFSDAVFIGDSITTGLAIYKEIENSTIIAHDGLNTSTILSGEFYLLGKKQTVLSALKATPFKKVYILLGANDVGFMSQSVFIENYQNFITQLRALSPDCMIYIQSIFPVTSQYEAKTPSRANNKIDSYNSALLSLALQNHIDYLNVAECLKNNENALPADQSGDGIHLNKSYYQKWIGYLENHTAME